MHKLKLFLWMWAIYQNQKHLSKSKLMEKQSQYDLEAENKRN